MTRIIVAGSRGFDNYSLLCRSMDRITAGIREGIEIVSGHARGADALGEKYAREHGLQVTVIPAHWEIFGRSAGMIRNQEMIDYALKESPLLVAFWDGESKGTENTIKRARKAGVDTRIILFEDKESRNHEEHQILQL